MYCMLTLTQNGMTCDIEWIPHVHHANMGYTFSVYVAYMIVALQLSRHADGTRKNTHVITAILLAVTLRYYKWPPAVHPAIIVSTLMLWGFHSFVVHQYTREKQQELDAEL